MISSETFSQCGNAWIFFKMERLRKWSSVRRVWFVTDMIKVLPSLIRTGLQRPARLPNISPQCSTIVRSALGCSSLYFSVSSRSRLSSATGGRFDEYVAVRGNPRKSAMMSSVLLEKFICGGSDYFLWIGGVLPSTNARIIKGLIHMYKIIKARWFGILYVTYYFVHISPVYGSLG